MTLVGVYITIYIIVAILLVVAYFQNSDFLSKTAAISNRDELERFKNLARMNMYYAVFAKIILYTGTVIGVMGVVFGYFNLILVLLLNGGIIVIAKLTMSKDHQTRSLHVNDPLLANEYKTISDSWVNDLLPKF